MDIVQDFMDFIVWFYSVPVYVWVLIAALVMAVFMIVIFSIFRGD